MLLLLKFRAHLVRRETMPHCDNAALSLHWQKAALATLQGPLIRFVHMPRMVQLIQTRFGIGHVHNRMTRQMANPWTMRPQETSFCYALLKFHQTGVPIHWHRIRLAALYSAANRITLIHRGVKVRCSSCSATY